MSKPHPYLNAPARQFWRRSVASLSAAAVDPVSPPPFRIGLSDKVVTAGSCFAQHISRRLRDSGYSFHITEAAHPMIPPEFLDGFGYGVYSARYGNIYSTRQLRQLMERAYGRFKPIDDVWQERGRFIDPFRPQIQPDGFASRTEYDLDRKQHFSAVRHAFEEMDYFVFTLGLTETWVSAEDGAAYPVCPGAAGGAFDPDRHLFVNFDVQDVVEDMVAFLDALAELNPGAKTILTVSPVPLVATAVDRHVMTSSTYSKAALRVAAEVLSRRDGVYYFPSFEIITGPHARGSYFADDLRSVTDAGVDHVMRLFFEHCTSGSSQGQRPVDSTDNFLADSKAVMAAICDEERLDPQIADAQRAT